MVLTVPLIIFMDDVSGNVSKQWNKHHVVYMSNAAMAGAVYDHGPCGHGVRRRHRAVFGADQGKGNQQETKADCETEA